MNNYIRRVFPIALFVAGSFFLSSCHSPTAKRYPFTGRVVSIDSHIQSAIIDGDAVPGFMDAMAMTYKVKPTASLDHLLPGDSISAELVVVRKDDDAPSDYWLENVKVIRHIDASHAPGANSLHVPAPGEEVPNFSFTNQSGKRISLKQYRGKVLLVTFIYTRCPFSDFCPRVSTNFAEIYQQVDTNPALAATHLLGISSDPEHDTPKVLRDYAFSVAHTHEHALFNRWEFATPRATNLPRLPIFSRSPSSPKAARSHTT